MYIALLSYIRPLEEVDALMSAHRDYLNQQYAAGVFVASGRREPRTGGVILIREHPRALVTEILEQDPFHKAGVARYELLEFTPSQMLAGFENYL